jgi:hypothetical protein
VDRVVTIRSVVDPYVVFEPADPSSKAHPQSLPVGRWVLCLDCGHELLDHPLIAACGISSQCPNKDTGMVEIARDHVGDVVSAH